MIRIKLTEEDFRALCAGRVVSKPKRKLISGGEQPAIEIALDDIGFGLMWQALETAMTAQVAKNNGEDNPLCADCHHPRRDHNRRGHDSGGCTFGPCICPDYKR
jgi:hypothetical protein